MFTILHIFTRVILNYRGDDVRKNPKFIMSYTINVETE